MQCPSCGAANVDGVRFCVTCGAALPATPAPGSWQTPSGNLYETIPSGGLNNPQAGAGGQPAGGGYGSTSFGAGSPQGQASSPNDYYQSASAPPAPYPPSGSQLYSPGYGGPAQWGAQGGAKAEPALRIGSFVIDILALIVLMIPLVILGRLPLIGWLIFLLGSPLVGVAYHLLRDSQGASPGKYLLGMKVVSKSGGEATMNARIMRNVLFAIPSACMIVPFIGTVIGGFFGFVIVVAELVMLLSTGERLGDRIANTTVVKTARG